MDRRIVFLFGVSVGMAMGFFAAFFKLQSNLNDGIIHWNDSTDYKVIKIEVGK